MFPVRLANGVELTIRPIRPDDKARLAAGHDLLSPDTQRLRFLMPKPRLTAADLRYLTEIDGVDHVAFVAVPTARDDVTMAVGRFVRDPERPDTAEFAIVVADELQGMGLGSRLAEVLASAAAERGIRRFSATVLRENRAVQRLLARISLRLEAARWSEGEGELVYELRPSASDGEASERRAA